MLLYAESCCFTLSSPSVCASCAYWKSKKWSSPSWKESALLSPQKKVKESQTHLKATHFMGFLCNPNSGRKSRQERKSKTTSHCMAAFKEGFEMVAGVVVGGCLHCAPMWLESRPQSFETLQNTCTSSMQQKQS